MGAARVAVVAVAIVGGVVGMQLSGGGGAPAGTAHIWVDTNGGTCTRSSSPEAYSDAAACGSLDAAYDAANATADASTVLIKGGTYTAQQSITGNRTSSSLITMTEASGETVVIDNLIIFGCTNDNCRPSGPDYVVLDGIETDEYGGTINPDNWWDIRIGTGSTNITVQNTHVGSVLIQGAHVVNILDNELGPCWQGASITGGGASYTAPCNNVKIDYWGDDPVVEAQVPSDIVFDGNYIHDFQMGPSCWTVAQGGINNSFPECHYECVFWNGVYGLDFRNNILRDCGIMAIFTDDTQGIGYRDVVIENNVVGSVVTYGSGDGRYDTPAYTGNALAIGCKPPPAGHVGYTNLTIRNNSLSKVGSWDTTTFDDCNAVSNITATGNIMVKPTCASEVTFSYNVYNGSGTCGTGDVNIGGSAFGFYTDDTHAPEPGDYVLDGAPSDPEGLVPIASCPSTDLTGAARGGSFCDAGAYER
jgi:hypothetical protein